MAKSLFWLSDEAWKALDPHLPRGKPGKPRVDDRTVISGILHVLKTGCRWRDVPSVYGPPTTIYNRYNRWSQRRVWQRIFEKIAAAGPVPDELSIDSSHVKAHRSASGSKRGSLKKRSAARGAEGQARFMLWPMIAADRSPFALTPGNVADVVMAIPLLGAVTKPKRLLADKAYDADSLRRWLRQRKIRAAIPSTASRRT